MRISNQIGFFEMVEKFIFHKISHKKVQFSECSIKNWNKLEIDTHDRYEKKITLFKVNLCLVFTNCIKFQIFLFEHKKENCYKNFYKRKSLVRFLFINFTPHK